MKPATPGDLLYTWKPSGLQASALEITAICQLIQGLTSRLGAANNQAQAGMSGAGAQAHAADGDDTMSRISQAVNVAGRIATALASPAITLQALQATMRAIDGMAKPPLVTVTSWYSPSGPWVKALPQAPDPFGVQTALANALAALCNGLTKAVMVAVKAADMMAYIQIGRIIAELVSSKKDGGSTPGGGPQMPPPNAPPHLPPPYDRDAWSGTYDGSTYVPGTGLSGADLGLASAMAGANPAAQALAGLRVGGGAALAAGVGTGAAGAMLPIGGMPYGALAGRRDDDRGTAAAWHLAEDDGDVFAGRDAPTDNGVLT